MGADDVKTQVWQPIETAPRGGECVLLFFERGVEIGRWSAYPDRSYPFLWKGQDDRYLHRPWKDELGPTHWMPLPEKP